MAATKWVWLQSAKIIASNQEKCPRYIVHLHIIVLKSLYSVNYYIQFA